MPKGTPKGGFHFMVDFEPLCQYIGTGLGIADAAESPDYQGNVVAAAHAVAAKEFDIDASASAGPKNLSHMWEFGVVGITRGEPVFADPTAPEARLWINLMYGTGNERNIGFAFRPAVRPNPRPSAKFYGVSTEVISRISRRKYVFKHRAEITETGGTVYIKPKDKQVNFVPFYGKPAKNPANADAGGYIWRPKNHGPMESTPGEESGTQGNFTEFWFAWWQTRGKQLISGEANRFFNEDVKWILMMEARGATHQLEDVRRFNSRGRVYNRRRKVKYRMQRQAATRGKIAKNED